MNHAAGIGKKSPVVFALSSLTFLSVVLAYLFPVELEFQGAPVSLFAYISSFSITCYVVCFLQSSGRLKYRATVIDSAVILYFGWVLISFFSNAVLNIAMGRADYLAAQVQSLVVISLMVPHYVYGRISNSLGLSQDKLISWIAPLYFLACVTFIAYMAWTVDLFLARQTTGQRAPLLIVFWAWLFGGIWLTGGKPWYSLAFLVGSAACLLSLTRAAYLQWIATLFFMFFAIGPKKMIKFVVAAVPVLSVTIFIGWHYSDLFADYGELIFNRVVNLTFAENLTVTDASASMRVQVWEGIVANLVGNPWALVFGYGQLGSTYLPIDYIGDYGDHFRGTSSHSQYLDTVVRAGLPGLILELIVNAAVISVPLFIKSCPVRIKIIAACLSGHLVYGAFHESIRWHVFGIVFWFFAGTIAQSIQESNEASGKRLSNDRSRTLLEPRALPKGN